MTATITAKLACAATIAGITPGRRSSSRSGAAACAAGVTVPGAGIGPGARPASRSSSAIRFGSGRTHSASARPTTMKPPAASHSVDSVSPSSVAPGEQRAEDRRAEDRAEDRAEQHERDPAGAAVGRIHVAGGGAGEQRGRARGADEHQPEQHGHRPAVGAADRREHAAGDPRDEARDEHGHAPVAVHQDAGRQRHQRARCERDRRPEAQQTLDVEHAHERQRGDGGRQLQRRGVHRHRRRTAARCCAGSGASSRGETNRSMRRRSAPGAAR